MQEQEIQVCAREFAVALSSLVDVISQAVSTYEQFPVPGMEFAYKKWKQTALNRLATDLQKTRVGLSDVSKPDNCHILLDVGENELGLAKNLDSFRYDFAGENFVTPLGDNVEVTVTKASALVHALSKA